MGTGGGKERAKSGICLSPDDGCPTDGVGAASALSPSEDTFTSRAT